MSQQTILAPEKKDQIFLQEIPLPKVVIQGTGASKNPYRAIVTWWHELPPESQGPIALLGMSTITFLTTSLGALVLTRLVKKRE